MGAGGQGRSCHCQGEEPPHPLGSLTEGDWTPGGGINQPSPPPPPPQGKESLRGRQRSVRAPGPPAAGRGGRLPEVLPIVLITACPQLRVVVVGHGRPGGRRRRKAGSRTEPGRRGAERTGSSHRRRHLRYLLPAPPPPWDTERAAAPRRLTGTRMLGGRGGGARGGGVRRQPLGSRARVLPPRPFFLRASRLPPPPHSEGLGVLGLPPSSQVSRPGGDRAGREWGGGELLRWDCLQCRSQPHRQGHSGEVRWRGRRLPLGRLLLWGVAVGPGAAAAAAVCRVPFAP